MRQFHWDQASETDLDAIASHILSHFKASRIFALHGGLGAGKTTLVKAFCRCLGVTDRVLSPTFTLIHEYGPPPIYHLDLYRLRSVHEAEAAGILECLSSGNYCFVEWPELIADLLPSQTVYIFLRENGPDKRSITVTSGKT
ncbi:MAG: tRNA (adenosine(37)-N6)-threonylcarbamoyltransferase complex ATPase subunit type 1 TsaE [Chitinophagales bacterium]|nr:tRNA (adenosine(37)-N6)-threonylcarbamoyltransferase complex ATPase subunit type 1 TsaE [Chitinophagales bacterium]MDW8392872.1 tRNA (adenosine(37)-N6)-threonylcarbamoyltransferase complex ATPase subunit type 1 TsaE [Chitinophagales bacterium]